jgi:hypothetical protein
MSGQQGVVLLLDLSTPQGLELRLGNGMSGQQELLMLLDLIAYTIQGPVVHLNVSTLQWLELLLNASGQQYHVLLRGCLQYSILQIYRQ